MKRFVVGDIHGAYKALKQCIELSHIDKEKDMLFCIGDVADGWPEVPECFNELLTFKNLIYVRGNHDEWMLNHIGDASKPSIWLDQGGRATIDAYFQAPVDRKDELFEHLAFLRNTPYYHLTEDNKLFVHGGYNYRVEDVLEETTPDEFMWDRDLIENALAGTQKRWLKLGKFNEVYIGHTATDAIYKHWTRVPDMKIHPFKPINIHNLWNVDTGAGWSGKLTMMDIDTKEIFQSDMVKDLYPDVRGR